jgi:hypothetical protein
MIKALIFSSQTVLHVLSPVGGVVFVSLQRQDCQVSNNMFQFDNVPFPLLNLFLPCCPIFESAPWGQSFPSLVFVVLDLSPTQLEI